MKKIAFSIKKIYFSFALFITFMDSSKANLVLEKMIKTWDWQTPPWLGKNPMFFQKSFLKAPFNKGPMWKAKVESLKEEGTGERSIISILTLKNLTYLFVD